MKTQKLFNTIRVRVIQYEFCSEWMGKRVWLIECSQQGFVLNLIVWVFELLRANCVYEFAKQI